MEKRLMTVVAGLALSTSMAFAQSQISGKVTASEDGSPVIGASIKVVGTNTGTVTDIDGNFTLNAPAGAKLEITYIGMNSTSVKAGKNMKIVLDPDNKSLDEVIVVAYGTAKKSAFTGSAAFFGSSAFTGSAAFFGSSAFTGSSAFLVAVFLVVRFLTGAFSSTVAAVSTAFSSSSTFGNSAVFFVHIL